VRLHAGVPLGPDAMRGGLAQPVLPKAVPI
jgi:hypothetical protein